MTEFLLSESKKHDFVSSSLLLYTAVYREMAIGPSVYTEYVEDTRAPLVKGHLPQTEFDCVSTKNEQLHSLLLKHYEKDGEPFYQRTQLLPLFFYLEIVLSRTSDLSEDESLFKQLLQARVSYLRDLCLVSSIVHLKDQSLNLFQTYIQAVRDHCKIDKRAQECLVMLLAEVSYC